MKINQLLNLSDSATEQEQAVAVQALVSDNERLRGENKTLSDAIDKVNQEKAAAIKAEAVSLVDAAVRDGRISAEGKATYLALFDKDFEAAKVALSSIPMRRSVTSRMTGKTTSVALADFNGKSWDELDRAGKLTLLKDNYPDVYAEKFRERFGTEAIL